MEENLSSNTSTIEEVFSELTTSFYLIKSCKLMNTGKINLAGGMKVISENIFRFPGTVALSYINAALEDIITIEGLGDKVVSNIRKDIDSYFDGEKWHVDDPEPDISEDENRRQTKAYIDNLLKNVKSGLKNLQDAILERDIQLATSAKNKLKLNLSVDEIGALFRVLKEVGIIQIGNTPLSRFIAQNFASKQKNNMSEANVKNKLDTLDVSSANSILALLERMVHEITNLRDN